MSNDAPRGAKKTGTVKKRGARNWDEKKDTPQLDFSNDAGVCVCDYIHTYEVGGVCVCITHTTSTHPHTHTHFQHMRFATPPNPYTLQYHPHPPLSPPPPPPAPGATTTPTAPTVDYQQRSRVDVEDDLPEEYAELLLEDTSEGSGGDASSGVLAGFVRSLGVNVLGTQALTAGDIGPALEAMKRKLMERNVAANIADKYVCVGVWLVACGRVVFWCMCVGVYLCVFLFVCVCVCVVGAICTTYDTSTQADTWCVSSHTNATCKHLHTNTTCKSPNTLPPPQHPPPPHPTPKVVRICGSKCGWAKTEQLH